MPKIELLSEQLINQIAAGEVVERPASVVKELLENAIDAEAQEIIIELSDKENDMIRVTDNGVGMDKEDAVKCLERHATSKIKTAEDLFSIHSMGFRGEALASIASVSKFTLRTKRKGDLSGTEVVTEGGTIQEVQEKGLKEGTQIEVRDLFFNTPARKKYLKNSNTEYQHIVEMVTQAALAFPEIAFRLIHNEKTVFNLLATTDEKVRIREVLGKNISDELIPMFYGGVHLKLSGFIGKPLLARGSKNLQYLFVNNRPIKSHVLSYAVKEAYHSLLPREKYPVFILKFELQPDLVDVNVHPRKTEVKFVDEREVFRILSMAAEKTLESHVLAPKIDQANPINYYQERKVQPLEKSGSQDALATSKDTVQDSLVFWEQLTAEGPTHVVASVAHSPLALTDLSIEASPAKSHGASISEVSSQSLPISKTQEGFSTQLPLNERHTEEELIPLAQLDLSFILCSQGSNLVIVDQHAAHERIRYTELMEEQEKLETTMQPLLTPLSVELTTQDISLLNEHKAFLESLGFELSHFGGNTFLIQTVPTFITQEDLDKTFLGLLDDLREQTIAKGDFQKRKEKALTYLACRSAIKFGDKLSQVEQVALVKKLQTLALPYTCPHGRPTMIILSKDELWQRFGRKYC